MDESIQQIVRELAKIDITLNKIYDALVENKKSRGRNFSPPPVEVNEIQNSLPTQETESVKGNGSAQALQRIMEIL
jgi:hypothetical protein